MDWKVPLADVIVGDGDIEAVAKTYRSGWLSMGPRIEAFEQAFAQYAGARHALAVSSGTAALHLICLAEGIVPGDEVIVPSITFVATVDAVRYTGATPVFADVAGGLEPWLSNLAIGEGGMVTTDDDELAGRVWLLRSHGMTTLTWDRHRGHASGYDVVELGFNYRMDEPRAALGLRRLARLDEDNARRGTLDARYREARGDVVGCAMAPRAGMQSAHHLFTIVLDEAGRRDGFRAALAQDGVQTSVHYAPAHRFAIYDVGEQDIALTETYGDRTVTLPLFAHMTVRQQDQVLQSVLAALEPRAAA